MVLLPLLRTWAIANVEAPDSRIDKKLHTAKPSILPSLS